MDFVLKKKDESLISFRLICDDFGTHKVEIIDVFNDDTLLLPLGLKVTNESLLSWLKRRNIPKNREFVNEILSSLGLKANDMIGLIKVGLSLSLNDDYWVVEKGFVGRFSDYNLYENDFNKAVALIAYTGSGLNNSIGTIAELTTHGTLRKAWRNKSEGIYLYKGGLHGFSNAGLEPFSEYYAFQVAEKMGLDATPYNLEKWVGEIASICKCFCTIDKSYYPISSVVNVDDGLTGCVDYYRSLGKNNYEKFCSMMVFDSLIYNTDRHMNNFGILRDNDSGKIIGMAPLFDHGFSLFDEAMEKDFDNLRTLKQYRDSLNPALGISFEKNAFLFMGELQKNQLKKLIGFQFNKHPKYNIPDARLKMIEDCIQERVRELVNIKKTILTQQENVSKIREFCFSDLDDECKRVALKEIKLEKDSFDEYKMYSDEEFAEFFLFIPGYDDNGRVVNMELIQKVATISNYHKSLDVRIEEIENNKESSVNKIKQIDKEEKER